MEKAKDNPRSSTFRSYTQTILASIWSVTGIKDRAAEPTQLQTALWYVLALTSILFFFAKFSEFQIGSFQDDAKYVVLAQSVVHSDTYGLINSPGEPSSTQFPFGFPLLLAPFVFLFPNNLDVLRLVSLFATVLNAALLFWGWRSFSRTRSYWWALAITGLYVLSPLVVDHSRMVMSEPIFTTFCLIALLLTERAAAHREGRLWVLWMGIALFLVLFVRTVGFTLVLTVFGYLIWRRGIPFVKSLLPVMLVIGALVGLTILVTPISVHDLLPTTYVSSVTGGGGGGGAVDQTTNMLVGNTLYKLKQDFGFFLRQLLIPIGGGSSEELVLQRFGLSSDPLVRGLLLAGIVALGFVSWVRREGFSSFNTFVPVYFAITYFWSWSGARFLYPIEPQLQFCFLLAIEVILGWTAPLWRDPNRFRIAQKIGVGAAVLLLLGASLYKSIVLEPSTLHMGNIENRTTWIKANTLPTDIIMTEEPTLDYMNSNRKTVFFDFQYNNASELEQAIQVQQVDYVLTAPSVIWREHYLPVPSEASNNLLPLLATLAAQNRVVQVYTSPQDGIQVFKVQP